MEKSKSISLFIARLKIAFPNYFEKLSNEQILEMATLYQDMLGEYNDITLDLVAKDIIKNKKFMPSLAEIVELCNTKRIYKRNEIIELMIKDGYFKSPREIEKVYMWIDEGIIPSWLKEDMKKYYNKGLENKEIKLLES